MRIASSIIPAILLVAGPALAAGPTTCELKYQLNGWSAIYESATGHGHVKCENGQSADVHITLQGGGFTAGKFKVDDGTGKFSEVKDISEIFGDYATAQAAGGAVKSGEAQVLTKGPVSLALAGKGRGWELGVAVGKLSVEHAAAKKKHGKH
jgi:hypothetical protein